MRKPATRMASPAAASPREQPHAAAGQAAPHFLELGVDLPEASSTLIRQNGSTIATSMKITVVFEPWNQTTPRIAQPTDGNLLRTARMRRSIDRGRAIGSAARQIAKRAPGSSRGRRTAARQPGS